MPRKQADLIFTVVLLALMSSMVWEASQWDFRARLFPEVVGIAAIGVALLQLGFLLKPTRSSRRRVTESGRASATDVESGIQPEVAGSRRIFMLGWVLAMAIGVELLGFEIGSGLLAFLFLRFASHERLRTCLLTGLVTYLAFYVVFDRALLISFPPGAVAEALGMDKPLDHYLLDALASVVLRN